MVNKHEEPLAPITEIPLHNVCIKCGNSPTPKFPNSLFEFWNYTFDDKVDVEAMG